MDRCRDGDCRDLDAWLADLGSDVSSLLTRHDKPATLIGRSLGGVYAREVAKRLAPRLRQVITIGTPFSAAANHSHVRIGWNRQVLQVVQERLLRRTGPWRRYVQAT